MTNQIKVAKRPDGSIAFVTFDNTNRAIGKDYGRRVKHYVYKNKDGHGYWHEIVTLVSKRCMRLTTDTDYLSARVFFGKVRLYKHRELSLPETWKNVAYCVNLMEVMK